MLEIQTWRLSVRPMKQCCISMNATIRILTPGLNRPADHCWPEKQDLLELPLQLLLATTTIDHRQFSVERSLAAGAVLGSLRCRSLKKRMKNSRKQSQSLHAGITNGSEMLRARFQFESFRAV